MAVIGKITNEGLNKSIEAQSNEGWKIYPTSFGVSDTAGTLSAERTIGDINAMWYQASISSRVVMAPNSIVFICEIPPDPGGSDKDVEEIYIFAKDTLNNDFLLAIGQPNTTIVYDHTGSLTFRLIITLANVEIGNLYEFKYTQATEISSHNTDPNSHQDLQDAMAKGGIFVHDTDHEYVGQFWDEKPNFDTGVSDGDAVYMKASDGKYYQAIADGSEAANFVGIADVTNDKVIASGFIGTSYTATPINTEMYLSATAAGELTDTVTAVRVGVCLDNGVVLIQGGGGGGEISDHNTDDDAHPSIQTAMAKAGVYVDVADHEYRGQNFDEKAVFDASVTDEMLVYKKESDGKYYPALADGTEKAKVAGVADVTRGIVMTSGLIDTSLAYDSGTDLYLSISSAGQFTDSLTPVKVGLAQKDGVILLGTVGGGSGTGDISGEDVLYEIMLAHSAFADCYYDTFRDYGTVDLSGAPLPTFQSNDHLYEGDSGSILTSPELLPDTDTRYKFFVHLEKDGVFGTDLEYSINDGVDWYPVDAEEIKAIESGFTQLKIRVSWTATGDLLSFGVMFGESAGSAVTDTKMLETVIVSGDHVAPYDITLPFNSRYTDNGKSLEVYLNRIRLIVGTDYEEKNNREVRFLVNLSDGDTVVFTEKWGYVDTSVDNMARLATEHDSTGYHIITDQVTGQNYKLVINNGTLEVELV